MSQTCVCGGKGWCRETRSTKRGTRRRYGCLKCGARWNTIEVLASTGQGRKITPTQDAEVAEKLRTAAKHIDDLLVRFS